MAGKRKGSGATGQFKTGKLRANGIDFHYIETGEGPLVLCLHGFPDNAHTFHYLLPALARAGFRAVAPYMRGYAPTSAPADGRYQAALLGMDALALIDALGAIRADIVGHDWGAEAAYSAAILKPEKVRRLVTIAASPSGAADTTNFEYLRGIWHSFYFQMPSAEATIAHNDFAFLEDWWRNASPRWAMPGEILKGVKETFRQPGVPEAAMGYYRHSLNPSLHDPTLRKAQERVESSPIPVPTLALHGNRDRPGRLEVFQKIDRFFSGNLEKVVILDTGHFMHLEKPRRVNSLIVRFLKK